MIIASGDTGIKVMVELYQRVLDGRGMPEEWKTSVVVSIFKGKGAVTSCGVYMEVKLLQHAMKIVERALEKRIRYLVNINKMYAWKRDNRCLFILRRTQEEYQDKEKKLSMCSVDLEKASDRVPGKVKEWAMRKKKVPEVIVKAVMSLYNGAKTNVKMGSGVSNKFSVNDVLCTCQCCHHCCLRLWLMQ